jgi:hypothetical protein
VDRIALSLGNKLQDQAHDYAVELGARSSKSS